MGPVGRFATRMCAMVHLNQHLIQHQFQRRLLRLFLRQILLRNNSFVDVRHVRRQSGIVMLVETTSVDATLAVAELTI